MDSQGTRRLEALTALKALKALEGHLGTRALETLGHLGTGDTRALEGHLSTWALKALGYSGTRKALGHSGTRALESLFLADSTNLMFMEPRKPYRKR